MILDQILYAKPLGDPEWVKEISPRQLAGDTEGYLNLMLKFMCQGPLPDIEMVLRVSVCPKVVSFVTADQWRMLGHNRYIFAT